MINIYKTKIMTTFNKHVYELMPEILKHYDNFTMKYGDKPKYLILGEIYYDNILNINEIYGLKIIKSVAYDKFDVA